MFPVVRVHLKKNCTENLYMEMVRLHHVTIRL